jgi:hypothetical protein
MLCDPVTYSIQPPVFSAAIPGQGLLTLHYPATDDDLLFVLELLKKEAAQSWDVLPLLESFKTSFAFIAGSEISQVFMIRLDDLPVFEIEVHKGTKYDMQCSDFRADDGDYVILLAAGNFDQTAFSIYIRGLKLCLKYFFQFPEVKRIIAPLYNGEDRQQRTSLFIQAGLETLPKKTTTNEPDLFIISRPEDDLRPRRGLLFGKTLLEK